MDKMKLFVVIEQTILPYNNVVVSIFRNQEEAEGKFRECVNKVQKEHDANQYYVSCSDCGNSFVCEEWDEDLVEKQFDYNVWITCTEIS